MNESDNQLQTGAPGAFDSASAEDAVVQIPVNPAAEAFYGRAVWRMQRIMLFSGVALIAVVAVKFDWTVTLGATLGVALSWHNFRWLTQAVNSLGERITTGHSRERGGVIVLRFTSRILLIALGSYVIFKYSRSGLYGYLAGLCVPVPALFCEATYELFAAFRRGL